MATVTPAPGKGSLVKVNGTELKLATWRRTRTPGELEFPTTGMTPDADGAYEVPHAAGLVKTRIVIGGPYDTAAPYHGAPYHLRATKTASVQFGHLRAGPVTPARTFVVLETTDENEAAQLGRWEATLAPSTDDSPGYFTEALS
jgi:hypothetical protein